MTDRTFNYDLPSIKELIEQHYRLNIYLQDKLYMCGKHENGSIIYFEAYPTGNFSYFRFQKFIKNEANTYFLMFRVASILMIFHII